jgi:hypothetical protein
VDYGDIIMGLVIMGLPPTARFPRRPGSRGGFVTDNDQRLVTGAILDTLEFLLVALKPKLGPQDVKKHLLLIEAARIVTEPEDAHD